MFDSTAFTLQAFTLEGDQVYSQPTFRYYSSNLNKARFLTASLEDDIAQTTVNIGKIEDDISRLQMQKMDLNKQIRENQQEERKMDANLMKIQENKRKVAVVGCFCIVDFLDIFFQLYIVIFVACINWLTHRNHFFHHLSMCSSIC